MASVSQWPRVVAVVDMDAFYVSAELRRRPELRGLPVVVAGSGPRAVVTTASYEARAYGVRSAIPASRARALCREGVFLTPDFPYYRTVSSEVMAIVRSYASVVEVAGLDEAYLELTGIPAPRASMRRLQAEVHRRTGLPCSVGIGPNKLIAKIASDLEKPRGFVILDRETAAGALGSAPPGRIPGIGPRSVERLRTAGIRTVGELAAADPHGLSIKLGRPAGGLIRLARLEDDAIVTEERRIVSESRELTFDTDIRDAAELERMLTRLADELCAALAKGERRGRTVSIKVRLDDFSTYTRTRTLSDPVGGPAEVGMIAVELLRASPPQRAVRLLGVRVAGLVDRPAEPQLALAL